MIAGWAEPTPFYEIVQVGLPHQEVESLVPDETGGDPVVVWLDGMVHLDLASENPAAHHRAALTLILTPELAGQLLDAIAFSAFKQGVLTAVTVHQDQARASREAHHREH